MNQEKKKSRQINFSVTDRDYQQIKNNARACDQTLNAYLRESALNMCVVPIDLEIIKQYKESIDSYRNAISQLIYTIKRTGQYVPADLEYILDNSKNILARHKELEQIYLAQVNRTEQQVEKTVRELVAKRIEKCDQEE